MRAEHEEQLYRVADRLAALLDDINHPKMALYDWLTEATGHAASSRYQLTWLLAPWADWAGLAPTRVIAAAVQLLRLHGDDINTDGTCGTAARRRLAQPWGWLLPLCHFGFLRCGVFNFACPSLPFSQTSPSRTGTPSTPPWAPTASSWASWHAARRAPRLVSASQLPYTARAHRAHNVWRRLRTHCPAFDAFRFARPRPASHASRLAVTKLLVDRKTGLRSIADQLSALHERLRITWPDLTTDHLAKFDLGVNLGGFASRAWSIALFASAPEAGAPDQFGPIAVRLLLDNDTGAYCGRSGAALRLRRWKGTPASPTPPESSQTRRSVTRLTRPLPFRADPAVLEALFTDGAAGLAKYVKHVPSMGRLAPSNKTCEWARRGGAWRRDALAACTPQASGGAAAHPAHPYGFPHRLLYRPASLATPPPPHFPSNHCSHRPVH